MAGVLAVVLGLCLTSDRFRRVVLWGALWGMVFGVWVIAPEAHRTHGLQPGSFIVWMWLLVLWLTAGSVIGAAVTGAASLPAGMVWLWRPLPRAPQLAAAVWSLLAMPIAYFLVSVGIEMVRSRKLISGDPQRTSVQIVIVAIVLAGVALFAMYKRLALSPSWADGRRVRTLGLIAIVVGACALPFRVGAEPPVQETIAPPLTRRPNASTAAPVIVVGFDGGNWKTLQPLIERRRTPALAALMEKGQHGEVEALWPPYWSGPAWASIATGQPPSVTGVAGDLVGTAPGLPPFHIPLELNVRLNPLYAVELELVLNGVMRAFPMPRSQLKRAPIWERVGAAGGRVAVVRFPFTYPANDPAITVVSNVVSGDLWGGLVDFRDLNRDRLVSPPSVVEPVLRRFDAAPDLTSPDLREIFPQVLWRWPANTPEHPIGVLRQVFDMNEKTFDAAETVLKDGRGFDLFMLHVSSFDSICHAFWKFRFPAEFPERIDSADIQALGGVVDRYLIYLDRRLQRIFSLVPGANIVVVADHGQEAIPTHIMWNGWHAKQGVFLAGGPDIPRDSRALQVSYFDIVPLVLDLLGFERPTDLVGVNPIAASR